MERLPKLDTVLEELENTITDEHYEYVQDLHLRSMAYENIEHLPLGIIVEPTDQVELFSL